MNNKTAIQCRFITLLAITAGLLAGCAKLPDDHLGAQLTKFDKLRGQRYAEIFLIGGNGITKNLKANIYNTLGLNSPTGGGDTTPQTMLDKVDLDTVKKEYDVLSVYKNAPRLWTIDWIEAMSGKVRDFNGLQARWVMLFDVPKELINKESLAYKQMTGKRDTRMGFDKGTPLFMLDDPQGNTWVMKSASLIVDPKQTYESLKDLGSRLKPPTGWKFRTTTLDQDMIMTPRNGQATITQDELGNTYDLVGEGYSNVKP
jgi:hypothetical protein